MLSGESETAVRCKKFVGILIIAAVFLCPGRVGAAERLYYFFSFSVPEASIKAAFADGEKIGLIAVLRGLPEGSVKESLLRLKRMIGERKIEVVVDPLLFRLYGIAGVPTLVYAEEANPSCEHCEPVPRHWKAVGDIPMTTALEHLSRSAPFSERYLKKLREGFFSK